MKITAGQLRMIIEQTMTEETPNWRQKPKRGAPPRRSQPKPRESDPRAAVPQQAQQQLRHKVMQSDQALLAPLRELLQGLMELTNATGDQSYLEYAKSLASIYKSQKPVFQSAG